MITALVLAAGESRRMGMPKPLLRFGATSFLEQIVSVLSQSNVDRVIVVLGAQAERIQALTDLSAADVVLNCDYDQGQLSSLIAGLRRVTSATDAIVLCLVDSPLITTAVVNRVIAGFRTTGRPIVVPVCEGRRGHPTLFARAVFDELLTAPPDQGARYVVHLNESRVLELEVSDPAILTRIDTPQDYRTHFGVGPSIIE